LGAALASAVTGEAAVADDLVQARLVAETIATRPGDTVWLAVELAMKPGWHTYWRNPGDAGQATEIAWSLPAGYSAGQTRWPAPKQFVTEMVTSYGYDDRVALLAPVAVPVSAKPGSTIAIAADVNWLVCENICVPGAARLGIDLKVATDATADAANAAVFARARAGLPRAARGSAAGRASDETIVLDLPAGLLDGVGSPEVAFLPFDDALIDHGAAQRLDRAGGRATLTLRRGPKAGPLTGDFAGVLVVRDKSRPNPLAFDLTATLATP
jgi:thiol:disulfide interchange protein DsbD